MADSRDTPALVSTDQYSKLRSRVQIIDSKSKTLKWLEAQIHERVSAIAAYRGQIANLEGMLEIKQEELDEFQARLEEANKI